MDKEHKGDFGHNVLRRLWTAIAVIVMINAVLIIIMGNVVADQSSGDDYGYRWTDSNAPEPTVSYNWIEISGTGVDSGIVGDDEYGSASLGFDFTFYGNTYSSIYISTNGYLDFGTAHTDWSNDDIPDTFEPNNFIAPFWDDLYDGGGTIYYQTIGSAPNRQFVVEYHEWYTLGGWAHDFRGYT